jgi:hypothetical protein
MTLESQILAALPERRRRPRRRAGLLLAFTALAGAAGWAPLSQVADWPALACVMAALGGTALVLLAD